MQLIYNNNIYIRFNKESKTKRNEFRKKIIRAHLKILYIIKYYFIVKSILQKRKKQKETRKPTKQPTNKQTNKQSNK
ncbi:hypothetical protein PFUGPA_01931 [Plasmodium falciparum Palo Alto/Uganda]|uniref:Uncharacterized protein n=1 Tax=Plasmodium falciparum (isolate Palo Alto / Uganda) TaxID=57270 RepID=W4J2L7_PLAFP|nr:hypothetical protein PFUGPA_01931 [Plasmodium falciparum Palo Alto/Uganda]